MSVSFYRAITWISGPLINHYLSRRLKAGKEDPHRFEERKGSASCRRPEGPLVWIHAASVGESLSMISLIDRLTLERPEITILMTSGTVSSARLLHNRLPETVIHQYIPVDRVPWVKRFLDHWKPNLALWVESEFWPSVLSEVKEREIPTLLMNARISAASFRGWRRAPWMIGQLLETFDLCMAQTELDADRLRALGAKNVACPGNLKFAAAPLPTDADAQSEFDSSIAGRPRWVAFSTHSGEEEVIADTHEILIRSLPDLLTIVVPRHPERAGAIEKILSERNLSVSVRSRSEPVNASKFVLLADTIGELGLFFRATDIAFVGGTLVPHGGQNPIEPARLGCAIVHGVHMENFLAAQGELMTAGASSVARSADELAKEIGTLLSNSVVRQRRMAAARSVADGKQGILDAVFLHIDPYLNRISPAWPISVTGNARA
ncbi:MAG: 3-deoxy-D-manno-octulosonic acid transferase [Pelagibacteraceae bacterium]|nr:3-deoxy-D-manno-octulosonic acid transferase [Pelagibacteraceae bacterium]PPR10081.1 MAG: 3-deoxy-D-manno-octulosonic acid transferase [Alphaproteobacteria bacterium MarineAlpha11_Bin1]